MKNKQELIKVFSFYKRKTSLLKKIFLIVGLAILFINFGIFSIISNGNTVKWLYSIPVAIIIVVTLIIILNILLNKQNKKFIDDFLKNIVKILDFEAIYTYNDVISVDDLADSSILNYDSNSYEYTFNNNLKGNIYDYNYRSSFVKIKKRSKDINFIPFNGRVFIIDYFSNNSFLIYSKNTEYNTSLVNVVYEDKFIKIFADDISIVHKTIKDHQIRNIAKFIEKSNMNVSIEFKNNKIYIMSWNKKKEYSLSEMNTINNIEFDYFNEFNIAKEVLDVLDL